MLAVQRATFMVDITERFIEVNLWSDQSCADSVGYFLRRYDVLNAILTSDSAYMGRFSPLM
jgi:hypothetical protein